MDWKRREAKRGRRAVAVAAACVALLILPGISVASSGFDDVPDDHTFKADIDWLASVGITKGCNPAQGNTKFCPDNHVTRAQMAAFMNRMNTYLNINFLANDGKAVDADKLDGKDSTAFLSTGSLRPVATAYVEPEDGFINVATGTGFSEITRFDAGIYCLTLDPGLGISREDVVVNVSVEWGNSSGNRLFAYWQDSTPATCDLKQIEIRTYSGDPLKLTDNVGFVATALHGPLKPIPTG